MAFQVEVDEPGDGGGAALAGLVVEFERYNKAPPRELPPDEHVTRAARTSRAGVATMTLTEPGWWAATAVRDKDGVRHRATFWVHVDDDATAKPGK
jgi:hypothetical protein